MDPVSLIVAALAAGATAALKDTTTTAVTDAYQGLKALLVRRFGDSPEARAQVERVDREPEAAAQALRKPLADSGAASDAALVEQARELLARADPAGTRAGKYTVSVTGGKGVVVGDHNTTTMNFDD